MRRATQTRSGEAAGLQDSKAKGDVPPSCASRLPPFNIRRPTPCRNKYAVNTAQLPAFLPMSAAIRALNVGRSMLLLRSRASPGEGPAATGLAALHFLPCCRGCPRSLLHPHLFSIASTTEALSTVDNRAVADILDSLAETARCDGPSFEAAFGSIGSRVTSRVFALLNEADANLVDTVEVRSLPHCLR